MFCTVNSPSKVEMHTGECAREMRIRSGFVVVDELAADDVFVREMLIPACTWHVSIR